MAKKIIEIIYRLIKKQFFVKDWRQNNQHNTVIPGNLFDPERVRVGQYSYGSLKLIAYNPQGKDQLIIGNFVSISSDVYFFLDENHQTETATTFPLKSVLLGIPSPDDSISKGSIIIEDEVWIGNSVRVLSGVRIGKGAIVATGSVVTKDIPPYSVAGGIPAKVIKYRFSDAVIGKLLKCNLVSLPKEVIKKNIEVFYKPVNEENIDEYCRLFSQHEGYNE